MATIGELVVNLIANTSQFHGGLDRAERRAASFSGNASAGFRKAENAIVDMGLKVIGLDGKLGKLAEGALIFGVGGAWTVAITAGLALGSAAWRQFAKDADEGAKAGGKTAKDLAKDFDDAIKKTNPDLQYRTMLQEITRRSNELNATVDSLTKIADNPDLMPGARAEAGAHIGDARKELEQLGKAAYVAGTNYNALLAAMSKPIPKAATEPWMSPFAESERRAANVFWNVKMPDPMAFLQRQMAARKAVQDQLTGLNSDIIASVEKSAAALDVKMPTILQRQVQMAAFVAEVWKSAARNIQTALADSFESFFKGQMRSAEDFVLAIINVWERALAEIAAAQVAAGLAPIVGGIIGGSAGAAGDTSLPASSAPATVNNYNIMALDAQSFRQFARRNAGALAEAGVMAAQSTAGVAVGMARI